MTGNLKALKVRSMSDECFYYCPYCARELVAENCDGDESMLIFVHDKVQHDDFEVFEVDRVIN